MTSGASEMIFVNWRSRSSRATGPKMRVPTGFSSGLIRTTALRSKRMYDPSRRRTSLTVRTTTARATSPFFTVPSGVASLMATMTVSPSEAYRLLAPPITRMHWTFLAPELSATSSIERGWIIGQDTWLRTLRIRQRFCFEIGRVSSMRTRSPTRLSLFSSCALSCFDIRMTRWYRGWRNTRSILTTRVFCIASDTTTPSRLFRSPTGPALPLAEHGVGPRQISPRLAQPRRVLGHPRRELEPEIEDLFRELACLLDDFVLGEIAPLRGLHRLLLIARPLIARASATRTASRYRSSGPPSGTRRAPRPPARRSSRTGCDRA